MTWQSIVVGMLAAAAAVSLAVSSVACADEKDAPARNAAKEGVTKKGPRAVGDIVISKETTHLEGPLRKDRRIDYLAALNRELSEGVTPENNAAVPLFEALGPEAVEEPVRERFFKLLGIAVPRPEGNYFRGPAKYIEATVKASPEKLAELGRAFDEQIFSLDKPWSAKDRADVARWLKANEAPLDAIAAAMARPRYYAPLVAEGDSDELTSIVLPAFSSDAMRRLGPALRSRAMLRIAEGKIALARADLLAGHRLARHLATAATLTEALVALALDGIASRGDIALVRSGKLDARQARAYAAELVALPPLPDIVAKVDKFERYQFLDAVMAQAASGPEGLPGISAEMEKTLAKSMGKRAAEWQKIVDWNEAIRVGNHWYDALVAAGREKTYAQKVKAANDVFDQFEAYAKKTGSTTKTLARIFLSGEPPKQELGRRIGSAFFAIMGPNVAGILESRQRVEELFELTRLALLLEAYRKDNGAYPKSLDELAPKYLAKGQIPRDGFSDAALKYRPLEMGFLLYSVGPNGTDEGGNYRIASPREDDVVIRVPEAP
jgi:hypothetical protein